MWYKSTIISGLLFLAAVGLTSETGSGTDQAEDPVLEYYWHNAGLTADSTDPNQPGVAYVLTTKSYRRSIGDAGSITRTDSVMQKHYFRDGRLDSVTTIRGQADRFQDLDLVWPSVFEMDYTRGLFPDDAGGEELAIELVSDSAAGGQPDGLVLIDRDSYLLRSLYLYYPDKAGFRRYTSAYRFVDVGGYVFPDSVWVVATRYGVFFSESYRLETGVIDVAILSAPPR